MIRQITSVSTKGQFVIPSEIRESLGIKHEPTQRIERIYVPTKTKKTEFLTGTPKEAAAKLLEKLRHEARVL